MYCIVSTALGNVKGRLCIGTYASVVVICGVKTLVKEMAMT